MEVRAWRKRSTEKNATLSKLAATPTEGNTIDNLRGGHIGSGAVLMDQFGSISIEVRFM
jgi:hypothetical protein